MISGLTHSSFFCRGKNRGLVAFAWVFGLMTLLSACASRDEGVAQLRSYRKVNMSCSGLTLERAEIDVPTFRKILHCFNSNGALEPVEALANRLSDADIQP